MTSTGPTGPTGPAGDGNTGDSPAQRRDLREALEAARIDREHATVVRAGTDRASTMSAFAQALGLPVWFGGNLDALYDALGDLDVARDQPLRIIWTDVARLRADHPGYADAVEQVLTEVAATRRDVRVTILA